MTRISPIVFKCDNTSNVRSSVFFFLYLHIAPSITIEVTSRHYSFSSLSLPLSSHQSLIKKLLHCKLVALIPFLFQYSYRIPFFKVDSFLYPLRFLKSFLYDLRKVVVVPSIIKFVLFFPCPILLCHNPHRPSIWYIWNSVTKSKVRFSLTVVDWVTIHGWINR